jgi:hypothetical protein
MLRGGGEDLLDQFLVREAQDIVEVLDRVVRVAAGVRAAQDGDGALFRNMALIE